MKKSLLLPLLFFSFTFLHAQGWGGGNQAPKITGKITGKLIDETTRKPVEFATVVLINAEFGQQLDGVITESDGKFKLAEVKLGKYNVEFSFLGYKTKMVKDIELTKKKPDINLKDVLLNQDNVALDEVTVTTERSVIENKVDKLVYNADQDITNAGGDAAEVLRKVPMLTVDLEGNVSLRGSQNIRILINGKPSGTFASSVADALKLIPADQIKQVEVITSPSAKYDGEGSAGIVNIITKKKSIEGISGSVDVGVGTRQNRGVASLNVARGRFGMNGSASSYYSWPNDGTLDFTRTDEIENVERVFEQSGITETSRLGFNARVGAFYDINAFSSINSSFSLNGFTFDTDGRTSLSYIDPVQSISQQYNRNLLGKSLFSGYDWTTDFTKKYKDPEKELVFAVQVSGNTNDRENDVTQTDFPVLDELNKNDGKNLETTFQVDYTHPFSKALKMEVGAKTVLRDIDSDYSSLNEATNIIDEGRTDIFKYDQNVFAGYLSFNINFAKKYSLVAGARYETTDIAGTFRDEDELDFTNDYANLLPSIILSRKLKNYSNLKISYNKRIQRPSLFYINPFSDDSDRRNTTTGNPNLFPELVHQFDIGYNTFVKGTVVAASIYYKYTEDIIESFFDVSGDIGATTFRNVGENTSVGFNIFSSKTIKWLTLRGNLNMYSYQVKGTLNGVELENEAMMYNIFVSGSVDLKKGWKGELWGFWNSPKQTLQGFNPSFSMYSFGIKKQLWDKRGSFGINVIDPFNRVKFFKSELEGENFSQFSTFGLPFRSFGVNFSYKFGKLDFKQQNRKSKIKNDDLKQGDGGGQGQGGGTGGGGRN